MTHLFVSLQNGHIFVEIDHGELWLLDTGSPMSFGKYNLDFEGEKFILSNHFQGLTVEVLAQSVGVGNCYGLIGSDILGKFDHLIDVTGNIFSHCLTISKTELIYDGQTVLLSELCGIPVLAVRIGDVDYRMFFDTGAQLSYFQDNSLLQYPPAGIFTDFHPSIGQFQVETYQVPVKIGNVDFTLRCGRPPSKLATLLKMNNIQGIVGNQIFSNQIVGYFPRRRKLILCINKLKIKNNEGQTLVHHAFEHGFADRIECESLTVSMLEDKDNLGKTPICYAFIHGHANQIPLAFFTDNMLKYKDNHGETPVHYAFGHGHADQIPLELLTVDMLKDKNNDGETPVHYAFEKGHADQIPLELLTVDMLKDKDNHEKTPVYYALEKGHADQIPLELFTFDVLTVKDNRGKASSIRIAFQNGHANQIPSNLLTIDILNEKHKKGKTSIHYAFIHGHADQIPLELLTVDVLCVEDNDGNTPIDYAIKHGHTELIPSNLVPRIT